MILGAFLPTGSLGCDTIQVQVGNSLLGGGMQFTLPCKDHKNHNCSICACATLNGVVKASVTHHFTASDPMASLDYTGELKVQPFASASFGDKFGGLSAATTGASSSLSLGGKLPLPTKLMTPLGLLEFELGAEATLCQADVLDVRPGASSTSSEPAGPPEPEAVDMQRALGALSRRPDFHNPAHALSRSVPFQDPLVAAPFQEDIFQDMVKDPLGASPWDVFGGRGHGDMLEGVLSPQQLPFQLPQDLSPVHAQSPRSSPPLGLSLFQSLQQERRPLALHRSQGQGIEAELNSMKARLETGPDFLRPNLSRMAWDDTFSKELEQTCGMLR